MNNSDDTIKKFESAIVLRISQCMREVAYAATEARREAVFTADMAASPNGLYRIHSNHGDAIKKLRTEYEKWTAVTEALTEALWNLGYTQVQIQDNFLEKARQGVGPLYAAYWAAAVMTEKEVSAQPAVN